MTRIQPVSYEQSSGKTKELLDQVKARLGRTPNMMKTMAQSPAVLEAYLNFSGALGGGKLSAGLREQIALISAEINGCGYCASAHAAIGKMVGLDESAIRAARSGNAADEKTDAALKFARAVIVNRGQVSDADLQAVKDAGFSDGEIGEIIANVALNIFTNYFNEIARTEIDFPKVEPGVAA
ncbi:MAG TPA: carboxymuconolactone decarboxylase family protein [Blastocatellia bacterium]|nr:carboxymuconolactone decarboxylase family protein [Blastocatellia bacterium]